MSWGAAIFAALKAIPELASIGREFVDAYKGLRVSMIEKKFEEMREEVNEITRKIEKAETNEERRALVRQLNTAISR